MQMTTDIIKLGHLDPNTDKSSPPVPTDISRVIFPYLCLFCIYNICTKGFTLS